MYKKVIFLLSMLSILFVILSSACSSSKPLQIAYVKRSGKNQYNTFLWLSNQSGTNQHEMFNWLGYTNIDYQWSSDGSGVYVQSLESDPKPQNYIFASLEKGPGPCITCNIENYWLGPFPSPQGDHLLVVGKTQRRIEFFLINPDGTGSQKILSSEQGIIGIGAYPDWSPDGNIIAFSGFSINRQNFNIYLLDVRTKQLDNFAKSDEFEEFTSPQWSPDGKKLAYYSLNTVLRIVDLDKQNDTIEVDVPGMEYGDVGDPGGLFPPQWSPDGKKIIFAQSIDSNSQDSHVDIFVVNADGTGLKNLTSGESGYYLYPVWSPDGRWIAYQTNKDGDWEIYVMNADGSNPLNVSHSPSTDDEFPGWQPIRFIGQK